LTSAGDPSKRSADPVALVVQKYGGTSVGSIERIRNVARRALATQREGHRVVLVVSAMSGETNRLLALAQEITRVPDAREMDALASTGEQVSSALVAMAVQAEGGKARSLLGHQVRVRTDGAFTKARIQTIEDAAIFEALNLGEIVVVAGFQGVDEAGNITTLGRGGSDTSAVAIAAAIRADVCDIFTDVDGVYTTDPNVCPSARKIERISFEEMLELASLGAKVLQIRSVEIAMKYDVPVHVRSSFNNEPGTIVSKEDVSLEGMVVTGIASDKSEARVHVVGIHDRPGAAAELFERIAEKNISVDMIVQNVITDANPVAAITFTMPKNDLARAKAWIEETARGLGASQIRYDEDVAKVSIVGLGMRSHAGVAAQMFRILAQEGINIQAISTSEIKISCLVAAKYAELAVRSLHDGFRMGKPD
jgi:aspartate kinase